MARSVHGSSDWPPSKRSARIHVKRERSDRPPAASWLATASKLAKPTHSQRRRKERIPSKLEKHIEHANPRRTILQLRRDSFFPIGLTGKLFSSGCLVAKNGQEVLEMIMASHFGRRFGDIKQPFGVILMDMQMPAMDGYTAACRLREKGFTKPFIALTAHAMQSEQQRCIEAGCDDYATKPIEKEELLA